MCGIAGLASNRPLPEIGCQVQQMTDVLRHRGPDGDAVWVDARGTVALGHRRLAVVDPGARSDQPMLSPDGRIAVTFNGELYNYREVRCELVDRGHSFTTASDTEVLVLAIAEWGVEGALGRLEGMFAFAAWDSVARQLWLCRDRFGIKPCYWMWRNGVLAFGSELKALFAWWREPMPLRAAAVRSLLEYGYVASPQSIFDGISQLEPGQLLQFQPGELPRARFYWTVDERKRQQERHHTSDGELLDEADTLLDRAVQQYLQADVPVGCFLSGGNRLFVDRCCGGATYPQAQDLRHRLR
jgi:asparagine synthase (glutamine-hydrolysing)